MVPLKKPIFKIFAPLAFVAGAAKQLKIGRSIPTTFNDRKDMVNLELTDKSTNSASSVLFFKKFVNVLLGERPAIPNGTRPSFMNVGNPLSAPFFQVSMSFKKPVMDGFCFFRVIFNPFNRSFPMARRVFSSPISGPLSSQSWPLRMVPSLSRICALNANSVGNVPVIMSVRAWRTRGVVGKTQLASYDTVLMFRSFRLTFQRVFRGTLSAEPGSCITFGKVPVPAGFTRPIKSLAGKLGRFSLRNWSHFVLNPGVNYFYNSAALTKGQVT